MEMCIGSDIGNAKTEIAFMGDSALEFYRQPSVISYLTSKPEASDNDEEYVMKHLLDNLSVSVFSDGLHTDGVYFVGNKALTTPENIRNMPIGIGAKSENDIPLITTLSMLSALGLQKYYREKSEIPSTLTLKIKMGTAIPSSEYTKVSAKRLEDRFTGRHTVNMFLGESTTMVNLEVTHCKVTEEGKTAMLAFANSDSSILKDYNDTYGKKLTPKDFSEAQALHADIGDGTSEIIYTDGYNPVPGGSRGVRVGVGHATENAIELYKKELGNNTGEITRQHFMKTLNGKTEKSKIAREKMKLATIGQSIKILEKIQECFGTVTSSNADYFFVHGGGSIVFKDDMYELLKKFASDVKSEVVWIPEEYATQMNSKGTYHLAKLMFCKDKNK